MQGGFTRRKTALRALLASWPACVDVQDVRSSRLRAAASATEGNDPHAYGPQPTKSVATPRPPAVKGEVLAMLACGYAWLRSRFAPLTAVAASLFERCRLRRNAGLCLTRGMRGLWRESTPLPLSPSAMMRRRYLQEQRGPESYRRPTSEEDSLEFLIDRCRLPSSIFYRTKNS